MIRSVDNFYTIVDNLSTPPGDRYIFHYDTTIVRPFGIAPQPVLFKTRRILTTSDNQGGFHQSTLP